MERSAWWMALLLGAALSVSCGGDDSGGDDDDGNTGESGSGGSSGGAGGSSGGGMIGGEGIVCGSVRCTPPEGSTAEACCIDAIANQCGMRGGFGGTACVEIVEVDPRCPVAMAGPIMLASCCVDNMCGVTAPMFGMAECTELSVAEQRAIDMSSQFDEGDGGIDFPGDGGGFMLDFPDPQPCE